MNNKVFEVFKASYLNELYSTIHKIHNKAQTLVFKLIYTFAFKHLNHFHLFTLLSQDQSCLINQILYALSKDFYSFWFHFNLFNERALKTLRIQFSLISTSFGNSLAKQQNQTPSILTYCFASVLL